MGRWRNFGMALAGALVGVSVGRAQVAVEPPGGAIVAPPTASAPAATQTRPAGSAETLPSATSVLQQMLNSGTAGGVGNSEPLLIVPVGPELGTNGLLREGQEIELRAGRLKKDDTGRMVFVFDAKEPPAYPPMELIPSRRLAAMEDAAGYAPGRTPVDMVFRIKAEVTEYRGKNFLYIKPSAIAVPAGAIPVAAGANLAGAGAAVAHVAAPNVPAAAPLGEGSVISNRVGRLVRDPKTGAKLIAFDADGKRMGDPPMGVVPSKCLTILEDATEDGNKPMKFSVSGEVTTYRGKNYLYLKAVRVVPDLRQGIGPGQNVGG
jgi:hypothetical protein